MSGAHWYPAPDTGRAVEQVTADFRRAFGGDPDGVWAAPGRVNLIGEHVDYNDGLCLPMALPHSTFAAVRRRDDDQVRLVSRAGEPWSGGLADIAPGRVAGWAGYVAGVPWALQQEVPGAKLPGFEAAIVSEVPVGAGLSSSAALECAVAVALDDLGGLGLAGDDTGRARLARVCVRAETEIAGAPTGGLDQTASLRARAGHALELDCRDFSLTQVPFDTAAAGLAVLVMDTRVQHALVEGDYRSRREACVAACGALQVASLRDVPVAELDRALARLDDVVHRRRVRHVVTEIERVRTAAEVLQTGRIEELGPLFDASHASLRDDYEVSCPELDLACERTLAAGALGARMTGGGFGGAAIALVRSDDASAVADAVAESFARTGFGAPAFLLATPATAASRVA